MIEVITLQTSSGSFFAHHFRGRSGHLIVFIPGLMESKAGLFYIFAEMARYFSHMGHCCLLFDLAGQGDSLLPLSFDLWYEQRNAILNYFSESKIHLLTRGIGSCLLTHDHLNFALNPSLFTPTAEQFEHIRWTPSPFKAEFLTPKAPNALSKIEKECFHRLGAEAECIGGLQLPITFIDQLPSKLPYVLPGNTICYPARNGHPLFDKQSERDILIQTIAKDLETKIA